MRIDSYAGVGGDTESYVSPFSGLAPAAITETETERAEERDAYEASESPFEALYVAESPFTTESGSQADEESMALSDFLASLHDEEFEDALDELLNEGAAQMLGLEQEWSSAPSVAETQDALEQWLAPLGSEWTRAMDGFAAGLENADLLGMGEQELGELLDSLDTPVTFASEGFENFFGKLIRKAKNVVRSAVRFAQNPVKGVVDIAKGGLGIIKSGIQAIGKHLVGPLLEKLKSAGLALLKGVLQKLIKPLTKVLPASIRPLVPILLNRLGINETSSEASPFAETSLFAEASPFGETLDGEYGTAAELSEAFDGHLASLLFASETDQEAGEPYEMTPEAQAEHDPIAELDDARARLATQLTQYSGPGAPVAEIEQFIPAVLAIRPLLKIGLTLTGARDKLIRLIATPLANWIRGLIGPEAVKAITLAAGQDPAIALARAGVGVGFTALGLEAPEERQQTLAGEALASVVEATVHQVADELTEAAAADPLQVTAAVQRAFAEAAAAYVPDRLLRPDLPERETAEDGGFWVLMPRSARPRYRFRRYTRVLPTTITRPVARAIMWSDGGTLESYLLDRGVDRWPVQAEVDLYETLAGTFPGHFTRDETLPPSEKASAEELQPLTPQAAGLLLREPALGRRRPPVAGSYRPIPGQRYFRVRVGGLPGRRVRRPRRLVAIRWDPSGNRLRILIRLSEQRARALAAKLHPRSAPAGQRDLPAALSALTKVALPGLQRRLARRFSRSSLTPQPQAAAKLAGAVVAATSTGIATYLRQRGAQLATAIADPKDGVTLTVTFTNLTANPTQTLAPTVTAEPGWRDGWPV